MLDVDHFKIVNDTHGHPSGDYVLKELAVILKNSVRDSDVVARTGGEEFSVILPKADREQAAQFAERIRCETSQREFDVYGKKIHVTISIGFATYPLDAEITDAEMLVYFADQALLHAKESGRDRVVPFGELDLVVRRRLRRQHLQMKEAHPSYEGELPCEADTAADTHSKL
jgi:diguanylate cyclase